MNAIFKCVERGNAQCQHCRRPIKILCHIILDGEPKVIGSSCIAKFVPELARIGKKELARFMAVEKEKAKKAEWVRQDELRKQAFELKMTGTAAEFTVKVCNDDLEYRTGLEALILNQGFNAMDSHFGHSLANQEMLSDRQCYFAEIMLRKYRKQLKGIL